MTAGADFAEREATLGDGFLLAGGMLEHLTRLQAVAADVDDDRLSQAVERIRLPLMTAAGRVTTLRQEPLDRHRRFCARARMERLVTFAKVWPCGKRIDRNFGNWSHCWLPMGHTGPCVFGISR